MTVLKTFFETLLSEPAQTAGAPLRRAPRRSARRAKALGSNMRTTWY